MASSARRGKSAVDNAPTNAANTATAATAATAATVERGGGDTEEMSGLPGAPQVSALSVADRVVTEYEKLLEAIPTMARHMGRLQGDTETMAEGKGSTPLHRTTSYPIAPNYTKPNRTAPNRTTSQHATPYHTTPHHTTPHHTTPHHTQPHQITPYHTIPRHRIFQR